MKMSRTTLIVVALVLVIFFFGTKQAVEVVKRGSRVGPAIAETAVGLVPMAPAELLGLTNIDRASAGQSPLSLNEYAMARALRSEHGSSSFEVRVWVAWAIRNAAGGVAKVFDKLTKSKSAATSGFFARQITDARYAATNQAPYESDVTIAVAVLRSSASGDPTDGATNFFAPRLQDELFAKAKAGDPKYSKIKSDAADIRTRWAATGLVSRGAPPSAEPGEVEFFGPKARLIA